MNGIKQVSTALIQHIKANAPAFDGVGIAVPSPGNLFLLVFDEQVGGDYARAALDDRGGELFYVRLRTGEIEESQRRGRGSCSNDSLVTAKCRMVMQSQCMGPSDLIEHFLKAVRSFQKKAIGKAITYATSTPRAANLDFAAVVKSELSEEESANASGWEGARYVASIDFDLTYVIDCSLENCNC